MSSFTLPSGRIIFPALASTLNTEDMCRLLNNVKAKHVQRDLKVVSYYAVFTHDVCESLAMNHSGEWMNLMKDAMNLIVSLTARFVQSDVPTSEVCALSTIIAQSVLVKRAETSDKYRMESIAVVNHPEFPFTVEDSEKPYIAQYLSVVNAFWLAFNGVRTSMDTAGEMETLLVTLLSSHMETHRIAALWVSQLLVISIDDDCKTTVLDDMVLVRKDDTDYHSGCREILGTILR